jgi:hypothetical protein
VLTVAPTLLFRSVPGDSCIGRLILLQHDYLLKLFRYFDPCHRLTNRSRTTTKESRLVEYLNTFDAPKLTDAEIAAIDEAGAKEYHRQFVRSFLGTVALLSADISFPNSRRCFPRKSEV